MRGALNSACAALAFALSWGCLYVASRGQAWQVALAVWGFAVANFALFALMHEATHGLAAVSRRLNDGLGMVCGWAFPQSFTLQRQAHMGHHRRNRTDEDLYDYHLPHQSRWLRNLWLYLGNLLGGYYVGVLWGNLIYVLGQPVFRSRWFCEVYAQKLGFAAYVRDLLDLPYWRVSAEIVLAFAYQVLVFWALDLTAWGYGLAIAAFALYWSALQYVIHAWSARDVRLGAWNLSGNRALQWLQLNYSCHRAHHTQPDRPWWALQRQARLDAGPRPSFWRIYASLWRGVRPAPPMGSAADLRFVFPAHQEPGEQDPQR